MKPTVGRIVHYYCSEHKKWPAIITEVHSDTCVNLGVFSDTYGHVTSSTMKGTGHGEVRVWEWPQKAGEEKGSF